MRLIHNRPAQSAAPPINPNFERTEAQCAAVPDRIAAFAQRRDPVRRYLREAPGEKCGLAVRSV
jgi:hypothetical protein